MSRSKIPERQPISDLFMGAVVAESGFEALASAALEGLTVRASGTLTIRYAVRLLGKPHIAIIPGLIAIDYGTMLTGEEAWQFLYHRSNLYPRAEVFGFRNDGRDDMMYVKHLDLSLPVQVLAFANETDSLPIASPTAAILSDDVPLPPRLKQYLAVFPTVEAWRSARAE